MSLFIFFSFFVFFFLMLLRPPRSTLFPTRRSSDLVAPLAHPGAGGSRIERVHAEIAFVESAVGHNLRAIAWVDLDRKSTRLNSSHVRISYAVFCLKKKKKKKMNIKKKKR